MSIFFVGMGGGGYLPDISLRFVKNELTRFSHNVYSYSSSICAGENYNDDILIYSRAFRVNRFFFFFCKKCINIFVCFPVLLIFMWFF